MLAVEIIIMTRFTSFPDAVDNQRHSWSLSKASGDLHVAPIITLNKYIVWIKRQGRTALFQMGIQ